jgi:membrane protease YdiL (CAAX protease family)
LLGVGELAVASLLGHAAIRAAMSLFGEDVPADFRSWLTLARGGWMRYYLRTAEIAPLPLAVALSVLFITGEEILFRSILIACFRDLGSGVAVLASSSAFALAQIFHMPSWHAAMFPVLGGVLLGLVHGALFAADPDIAPLVVAHAVFLVAALL